MLCWQPQALGRAWHRYTVIAEEALGVHGEGVRELQAVSKQDHDAQQHRLPPSQGGERDRVRTERVRPELGHGDGDTEMETETRGRDRERDEEERGDGTGKRERGQGQSSERER